MRSHLNVYCQKYSIVRSYDKSSHPTHVETVDMPGIVLDETDCVMLSSENPIGACVGSKGCGSQPY